ncbi:hypothetical protein E1200_27050 [Actinomadura sp. GC306]|uniref:hypothetical protein n=1 Tax=Actinomadura sp. GC306 TaxID=2530367 RepID=UPI001052F250|nr:hypothetical protein [Actinomadura sp. GC306]TDC62067.1 hypothetical protein E1200_27050 [Actinomadura sp. GC306]
MPDPSAAPRHEALVEELRTVRERGLLRLRDVPLPALAAAATAAGLPVGDDMLPSSILRLIGDVVERLDGSLATATAYTLGVAPGTRDWTAHDRRRRAAQVYGVSVERFRKSHERMLLDNAAQEILAFCATETVEPRAAAPAGGTPAVFALPGRDRARRQGSLTLLCRPVETLRAIDVVVSSENVYLQMSKMYQSSLSGTLRNAAARRDEAGALTDDVLQRELQEWLDRRGRSGGAVAPGTVVPTGPGELASQGVRRIYHAAVAIPRPHSYGYVIEPGGVVRAVHQVFTLMRKEREQHEPPLRSVCLPLFGAGRGGLSVDTSWSYLWAALEGELSHRDVPDVYLVTHREEARRTVADALRGLGAVEQVDPASAGNGPAQ